MSCPLSITAVQCATRNWFSSTVRVQMVCHTRKARGYSPAQLTKLTKTDTIFCRRVRWPRSPECRSRSASLMNLITLISQAAYSCTIKWNSPTIQFTSLMSNRHQCLAISGGPIQCRTFFRLKPTTSRYWKIHSHTPTWCQTLRPGEMNRHLRSHLVAIPGKKPSLLGIKTTAAATRIIRLQIRTSTIKTTAASIGILSAHSVRLILANSQIAWTIKLSNNSKTATGSRVV